MLDFQIPSRHLRLVEPNDKFDVTLYWTRLQVGVKSKETKKQVWCTTVQMPATFEMKILVANAVAAWLRMHDNYIYISAKRNSF